MGEPDYYNSNGLSPLRAFEKGLISYEEYIGFIKGNIIKYVVRCDKKGQSISDVNKAMTYLRLLKNEFENDYNIVSDVGEDELDKLKNILKRIIVKIEADKEYSNITVQINNNDYEYFRQLLLEL